MNPLLHPGASFATLQGEAFRAMGFYAEKIRERRGKTMKEVRLGR